MTTFIIARPTSKAVITEAHFKECGLSAMALPIVNISLNQHLSKNNNDADDTYNFDALIITSTYAVDWLVDCSGFNLINFDLIKHIVFVGESTASAFQRSWQKQFDSDKALQANLTIASPSNSEGVLSNECFVFCDQLNVGLLKGKGGRNLIENVLAQKGASITVLDVYERIVDTQLLETLNLTINDTHCMVATSVEIVDALFSYYDKQSLKTIKWIVPSIRIKDYANSLGVNQVFLSKSANAHDLVTKSIELA